MWMEAVVWEAFFQIRIIFFCNLFRLSFFIYWLMMQSCLVLEIKRFMTARLVWEVLDEKKKTLSTKRQVQWHFRLPYRSFVHSVLTFLGLFFVKFDVAAFWCRVVQWWYKKLYCGTSGISVAWHWIRAQFRALVRASALVFVSLLDDAQWDSLGTQQKVRFGTAPHKKLANLCNMFTPEWCTSSTTYFKS